MGLEDAVLNKKPGAEGQRTTGFLVCEAPEQSIPRDGKETVGARAWFPVGP